MSNYEAIRSVLNRISGQQNVFTVPKIYVDFTGDLTTAILLNQIVFLSDKSKRKDGFFYKTYKDWKEEICLTERQVRHSTKKLKEMGLVETSLKKANGSPTVHYKLHYDKLVESILTFCQIPNQQSVSIQDDNMSDSLTETTTENTTESSDSSKKQFLDYVYLKPKEYEKLVSEYGEDVISKKIQALDAYLTDKKPDKYKDHNKTIRKWINKDGIRKKKDIEKEEKSKEEREYVKHLKGVEKLGLDYWKNIAGKPDRYYEAREELQRLEQL